MWMELNVFFFPHYFRYKLVGAAYSYCAAMGNTVGWADEFPECQGKTEKF